MADLHLSAFGMLSKSAGYLLLAFAPSTTAAFLASAPYAFSRFVATGIRASLANELVDANEQGRAFALVAIGQSVSALVGAPLANELMIASRHVMQGGVVFLAFAALLTVAAGVVL